MARMKTPAVLAAALLVSGCSVVSDTLFPSFESEPETQSATARPAPQQQESQQSQASSSAPAPAEQPPAMGTSTFEPPTVTPGSPTGTVVGAKIADMRRDLSGLQNSINQHNSQLQQLRQQTVSHAQRYHGTVAAINSRLQLGTTPGNPVLTSQWNTAQGQLDGVARDIAEMNSLANRVASDSSTASYLLETTRATYGLAGAVDEDHRQLAILEDEVNRTVVLIDRLLNELSEDINRQSSYLANERRNLTTLSVAIKNGELLGSSLANRAYDVQPFTPRAQRGSVPSSAQSGSNRPLVVIRFDRPNVDYEQALYTAVSRALERRPGASFDLVAVAPSQGSTAQVAQSSNSARRNAEQVLRSLTSMGLPASRVTLSAGTSDDAQTSEVHLYVR